MVSWFLSPEIFFSFSILGKLVILHKKSRKFDKTLKERSKTLLVKSKRNSVSERKNSTTQIGVPQIQVF